MGKMASVMLGPVANARIATVWMCIVVAGVSAFINNTPIVAAFVPLIQGSY